MQIRGLITPAESNPAVMQDERQTRSGKKRKHREEPAAEQPKSKRAKSDKQEKWQMVPCELLADGSVHFRDNVKKKIRAFQENVFGRGYNIYGKNQNIVEDFTEKKGMTLDSYFFEITNEWFGIKVNWNKEEKCFELIRNKFSLKYFLPFYSELLAEYNTEKSTHYKIEKLDHIKPLKPSKSKKPKKNKAIQDEVAVESMPQESKEPQHSIDPNIIQFFANDKREVLDKIKVHDPKEFAKIILWMIGENGSRNANLFDLVQLVKALNDANCEVPKELIDKLTHLNTKAKDNLEYARKHQHLSSNSNSASDLGEMTDEELPLQQEVKSEPAALPQPPDFSTVYRQYHAQLQNTFLLAQMLQLSVQHLGNAATLSADPRALTIFGSYLQVCFGNPLLMEPMQHLAAYAPPAAEPMQLQMPQLPLQAAQPMQLDLPDASLRNISMFAPQPRRQDPIIPIARRPTPGLSMSNINGSG